MEWNQPNYCLIWERTHSGPMLTWIWNRATGHGPFWLTANQEVNGEYPLISITIRTRTISWLLYMYTKMVQSDLVNRTDRVHAGWSLVYRWKGYHLQQVILFDALFTAGYLGAVSLTATDCPTGRQPILPCVLIWCVRIRKPGYLDYWVQNELKNSIPKDRRSDVEENGLVEHCI